ncbi:MAG: hypothetical protein ACI93R_002899 [Flavobacteriales bacterium]|jgi:hypothetical protein
MKTETKAEGEIEGALEGALEAKASITRIRAVKFCTT